MTLRLNRNTGTVEKGMLSSAPFNNFYLQAHARILCFQEGKKKT